MEQQHDVMRTCISLESYAEWEQLSSIQNSELGRDRWDHLPSNCPINTEFGLELGSFASQSASHSVYQTHQLHQAVTDVSQTCIEYSCVFYLEVSAVLSSAETKTAKGRLTVGKSEEEFKLVNSICYFRDVCILFYSFLFVIQYIQ